MLRNLLRMPHREDSLFGTVLITLFLVPLFFLPVIEDTYESPRFALSLVTIGACLLVLLYKNIGEFRISKPVFYSSLVFLGLHFLSTLFSLDPLNSILGIYGRFSNSLVFVLGWVALIFVIGFQNSENKILTLFRTFAISGFLVAVLGILHVYGIGFYGGEDNTARSIIPSFIGNQNFAAIFLVGLLPFFLPVIKNAQSLISRVIYVVMGLTTVWALMIFASRGAIVAFAIAMVVGLGALLIKKVSWNTRLIAAGFLVAGAFFAFFFYSTTRLEETAGSLNLTTNVSTQTRVIVWAESTNLIQKYPILGWGPGNFYIAFRSLGNTSLPGSERFDDAHNIFIHTATTVGIPALLALLAIIFFSLYRVGKQFLNNGSLTSWAIGVGMVALLIGSSFSPVNISIWVLFGFLIAASQYSVEPKQITISELRIKMQPILLVLGILFIIAGIFFLTSEILTQKLKTAYRAEDYHKAYTYGLYATTLNPINGIAQLYTVGSMVQLYFPPEETRTEIRKFISLHPNSSGTQKYGADLFFMLHDHTKANEDLVESFAHLETAGTLEPNYAPVLINKGYMYYKAKELELAEQALYQAVTLTTQSRYYFAWLLLAEVHLEKGELDKMNNALKQAYSIEPSMPLKALINEYESGQFTRKELPAIFPDINI